MTNECILPDEINDASEEPDDPVPEENKLESTAQTILPRPKEKPFSCQLCKVGFDLRESLKEHMKMHYRDSFYPCMYCNKFFKHKLSVEKHELTHTHRHDKREKSKVSDANPEILNVDDDVPEREHVNLSKPQISSSIIDPVRIEPMRLEPQSCTSLNKKTPYLKKSPKKFFVSNAMNDEDPDDPDYVPDEDVDQGRNKNKLEHTQNISIQSIRQTTICQICKLGFHQINFLKDHMRTHYRESFYPCMYCNKFFKHKFSVEKHESTHVPDESLKLGDHIQTEPNFNDPNPEISLASNPEPEKSNADDPQSIQSETSIQDISKQDGLHLEVSFAKDVNNEDASFAADDVTEEISKDDEDILIVSEIRIEPNNATTRLVPKVGLNAKPSGSGLIPNQPNRIIVSQLNNKSTNVSNSPQTVVQSIINDGFQCQVCKILFDQKEKLMYHMGKHYRPAFYPCMYCPKFFKYKSAVDRHEMTHTKDPPLICVHCSKHFNTAYALKNHMKTHVNNVVASFHCSACPQIFSSKNDLINHSLLHSTRVQHRCHFCNKPMDSMKQKIEHEKLHSANQSFSCPHCPQQFLLKGNLTRHVNQYHLPKKTIMISNIFGQLNIPSDVIMNSAIVPQVREQSGPIICAVQSNFDISTLETQETQYTYESGRDPASDTAIQIISQPPKKPSRIEVIDIDTDDEVTGAESTNEQASSAENETIPTKNEVDTSPEAESQGQPGNQVKILFQNKACQQETSPAVEQTSNLVAIVYPKNTFEHDIISVVESMVGHTGNETERAAKNKSTESGLEISAVVSLENEIPKSVHSPDDKPSDEMDQTQSALEIISFVSLENEINKSVNEPIDDIPSDDVDQTESGLEISSVVSLDNAVSEPIEQCTDDSNQTVALFGGHPKVVWSRKANMEECDEPVANLGCPVCFQRFKVLKGLLRHVPIHNLFNKFHCAFCPIFFPLEAELDKHELEHIQNPSKFPPQDVQYVIKETPEAQYIYNESTNMVKCLPKQQAIPIIDMTPPPPVPKTPTTFNCNLCLKTFTRKEILNTHLQWHDAMVAYPKPYPCKLCPMSFRGREECRDHMEKVCYAKIGYSSRTEPQMNSNQLVNTTIRLAEPILPILVESTQSIDPNRFIEIPSNNESQLDPEVPNDGLQIANFKCHICSKFFISLADLCTHYPLHNDTNDLLVCDMCYVELNDQTSLQDHLKAHAGIKDNLCHICDSAFTFKQNLILHLEKHKL